MRKYLSKSYHDQKTRSAERGIPFLLTFEQWKKIWRDSGCMNYRGRERGKYCMARFGDKGAYEVGNVKIVKTEENRAEQVLTDETREKMRAAKLGRKHTPEHNAKIAAGNLGRVDTPETRERKSAVKRGALNPMYGRTASIETRAKLSAARRAEWASGARTTAGLTAGRHS